MQAQAMQAAGQQVKPDPRLTKPTWDQVIAVLRDDKLRGFKIDIETDSTIQPDADAEQKNRIEFLTAISAFAEKVGPMVQTGLMPAEIAKELLSFGVRAFKVSPQLEDALDQMGGEQDGQAKQQQSQQAQQVQQAQQQMQDMEIRKSSGEAAVIEAKSAALAQEAQIVQDSHMMAARM